MLDVLYRMPVMTLGQAVDTASLLFGMPRKNALNTVKSLAKRGIIIITGNGFVTTKAAYDIVADEYDEPGIKGEVRIALFEPKAKFLDCIDCYDTVIDMFPISENFMLTGKPFQISFVDDERGILYEVMRYSKTNGRAWMALLSNMTYSKEYAAITRRIILLDDEKQKVLVPYYGFTHICVAEKPGGFRIIEKRDPKYAWKDMREAR